MRNVDTLVLRSTLTDSHWRSPRWVEGEPVALNALTMSAINQNCQSKLHSSLDVQLCIRRIHHWHLDNIFLVHSSYTDLTAKNINDSSSTRLAELRNSVRNSLMWLWWKRVLGMLRWIRSELYCDKRVWFY